MAWLKSMYHEEIFQLQFFFTCFKDSDEAADYVVHNSRQPGSFLLRPSTRTPGGLALTVRIDGSHARHVNVLQEHSDSSPTGRIYFVIRERCFNTFHDLYSYYSMNSITNMEHIQNVRLLNPIEKNREASNSFSSRSKPISISVTNKEIPPLPFRNPGGMSSSIKSGNTDFSAMSGAEGGSYRSSLDSEGNESRLSSSSIGSHMNEVPQLIRAPALPKPNGSNLYLTDPFDDAPVSPTMTPTSQSNIPKSNSKSNKKDDKYKKKKENKKIFEQMGELGWCRPPQPLPEVPLDDEVPYYSTPRPYRDHLDELKLMLRESEMCDCGLRMVDAELADGWTVHRSRESNTFKRVFYQHENGNTTWVFPSSIITFLSFDKICFILRLCKDSGQEPPGEVKAQYAQETNARGTRPFPSAQPLTTNSSANRMSSQTLPNSGRGAEPFFSARNLSRNATLDQRRPLPLPESTKL